VDPIAGVEVVAFADASSFECWLAGNHSRHDGVWVLVAKASSGIPSVTSDELVDVGLCFGWISGQRRAYDDTHYLQKYVPRRPRSLWSQVNVDKVAALIAAGRMQEPGMVEVRAARADGRWDAAYPSQKEATVPPDVRAALEADPRAKERFEALDRSKQYVLYLPVLQARTGKARAVRVAKLLDALQA
jgi:uncharacterized protein YdeI (YjbR/CyaY-like superfamily)